MIPLEQEIRDLYDGNLPEDFIAKWRPSVDPRAPYIYAKAIQDLLSTDCYVLAHTAAMRLYNYQEGRRSIEACQPALPVVEDILSKPELFRGAHLDGKGYWADDCQRKLNEFYTEVSGQKFNPRISVSKKLCWSCNTPYSIGMKTCSTCGVSLDF